MEGKVRIEYLRRMEFLAKSKLHAGNLAKAINTWAIREVRYRAGVLDWTMEYLKQKDVKTMKMLNNGATCCADVFLVKMLAADNGPVCLGHGHAHVYK